MKLEPSIREEALAARCETKGAAERDVLLCPKFFTSGDNFHGATSAGAKAQHVLNACGTTEEAAEKHFFYALRCAPACGSKEVLFCKHLRHGWKPCPDTSSCPKWVQVFRLDKLLSIVNAVIPKLMFRGEIEKARCGRAFLCGKWDWAAEGRALGAQMGGGWYRD
jgi:hypothetical protein